MRAWLLALAIVLSAGAAARADVVDHAKVFSANAVKEADGVIKDIEDKLKHPVIVETFAEIPADRRDAFDKAKSDKTKRSQFFKDWAGDEFKNRIRRGIYIHVCKNPGHVVIHEDQATAQRAFTRADEEELKKQLIESFGEKQFDNGLLAGLEYMRNQILAHQRIKEQPQVAKPSSAPVYQPPREEKGGIMGWLCPLLLIAGGFWIVIALIRAFVGMGRNSMGAGGYGGPGYGGYGGGGFMSTFLGGMFGSMAGNWMYNNMFGGGSHGGGFGPQAYGGEPDVGGPDGPSAGGDFAGSDDGGDFGGSDVGGDFGGGDFGGDAGGDFGGGDFGGDAGGDF